MLCHVCNVYDVSGFATVAMASVASIRVAEGVSRPGLLSLPRETGGDQVKPWQSSEFDLSFTRDAGEVLFFIS